MSRFVALLRGINVGRAKRVAMADLRSLMEALGYTHVRTLLNSGNVVFTSAGDPATPHADRIQTAIAETLGVKCLVIVKSEDAMTQIVAGNTLAVSATDPTRLLVAFTRGAPPSSASLVATGVAAEGDEAFVVGEHAAYLWCANGILESRAASALLREFGESGTTRNWATVRKIVAAMQEPPNAKPTPKRPG